MKKRVQVVSSESVKCNSTSADYKSFWYVSFISYMSEGLVIVVVVTGLRIH